MKRKLTSILLLEMTVAIILTWLLIGILPPIFDKYKLKKTNEELINPENWVSYLDVNLDGRSEKLVLRGGGISNKVNKPSNVVLYNSDNELVDQFNFKGKWYNTIEIGDYNNDNKKEVFLFSTKKDSIFLQGFSFSPNGFFLKDKFITKGNPKLSPPANIYSGKFCDINGDGFEEIIFSVMTSFKLTPRCIYAYDIKNDSIYKTEDYGCWRNQLVFFDINGDSIDEIICGSTSPGNTKKTDTISYPDTSAWLMVYNSHLKLQFEPLEFKDFSSSIDVLPFIQDDKKLIAVAYKSSRKSNLPYIALYSPDGRLIRKKNIRVENNNHFQFIMYDNKRFENLYLMEKEGLIRELDINLNTIRTIELKGVNTKPFSYLDIDNDSVDELIFLNKSWAQSTIVRQNLEAPVTIELPEREGHVYYSVKYNGDLEPSFVIQKGGNISYYLYSENWLFQIRYFIYVLISIVVFLFIKTMQILRNYQLMKENKKLDRKVQEQTNVLRTKNKLLRDANEEIQSQNQEIQAQSEEIMNQNEELIWYKEHLEKLVEEKTAELANALKKAEESDRLKTSFLQNISHEIRTPMNSVIGFISLLEGKDNNVEKEFKIITKSFNQLLNTIDDIILLSKLHLGDYQIKKENIKIDRLLDKLNEYGRHSVLQSGKQIFFKCNYCTNNELSIDIDLKSMQMVFDELIDNAIKYTESGEILIGCSELTSGAIKIYVKDSGVGIEEHKIKYIFDAFRKLEVENKLFRGTGAGLAIVKSIISLHNASIEVKSDQDTGTTFSVIFS